MHKATNKKQNTSQMKKTVIDTVTTPKNIILNLTLVDESRNLADDELIKELSKAISSGEVLIPWCNKVEKISIE